MTNSNEWKKSELEKKMESEGWKFMTNIGIDDSERERYIKDLRAQGYVVKVREAYGVTGKLLSDMDAIYARKPRSSV